MATDPQSAEAVRAGDARACGLVAVSDGTQAWIDAARARQRAYEADRAAFAAEVRRQADAFTAKINSAGLLPEGYALEWPPAPPTLADIAATMERFSPLRPRRVALHCHADVVEALKRLSETPPEKTAFFGRSLAAVDVFTEDDFGPGAWELREDGKVIDSGRLAT